ncbi:MAG: hypothetical protein JXA93_19050 [Anaerolineae bacterium]|nr:hypothetical protein [Anaerolineae bacterium]
MNVKQVVFTLLLAGVMLLAVCLGPGLSNGARALPAPGAEHAGTTIPYAGRLSDTAGKPVADGTYDLSFSLYGAVSGGQPLWSEIQQGVMVSRGEFVTSLGNVEPIPAAVVGVQVLWLAVGVRGPGEADFTVLTPRLQVSVAAPAVDAACPHDHFGEWWTGSSAGDGLWIYNSGSGDGLQVDSEGNNGVLVYHSAGVGMQVYEAGNDGVYVGSAGDDGMYVNEAGIPSLTSPSVYANGFEVAGAQGSGLWVGHAGLDGVTVHSADWYGVFVEQADSDGVRVLAAGGNGVLGISVSGEDYGGLFRSDVAGGGGVYAAGGDNTAPDLVLGVYGSGDDGRIYSEPGLTSSDILLFSNDEAHVHLDEDNNSSSAFVIYNGDNTAVWTVDEAGAVTFGTEAGDYGPRATYAVRATGDWIEDFGTAELVDGEARVTIEAVFARMVNLAEYQVFVTPLGDCPLYVAEKTPAWFTVRVMGGQRCNIGFDWRLVARRLGNEAARLEPASASGETDDD